MLTHSFGHAVGVEISKNTGSIPPHLQQAHESALEVFSEPAASLTTSIPDALLKEACQMLGLFGNEEDVIFLETSKSRHGLDPRWKCIWQQMQTCSASVKGSHKRTFPNSYC